jgi:hypothetical protein
MALAVIQDIAADPPDVRLLRAAAVVAGADLVAHAVEEPRPPGARRTCVTAG